MQRILDDHLADDAGRAPPIRHFKFEAVAAQLVTVFASLAWAAARDEADARRAFVRAWRPFSLPDCELPARSSVTAHALVRALAELAALAPLLKRNVIAACADCVIEDGEVMAAEAELLAAIALSLDCPLPPLPGTAA